VTFPKDYGVRKLAEKDAEFEVKVHSVRSAEDVPIDDELAKKIGLDTLDQLKERVREQMKADYSRASRTHLKRRILDALDSSHSFELPQGMVNQEFEAIWQQVEAELKREGSSPEDEGKIEDELKAEYRGIAERRVRLGLVLAKIGEQNAIAVSQEEVNRALAARARQFPGQEKQVIEYYTNNPQAIAEIRVPLFEDKVIDFLAELIEVKDRPVAREILFLDPDEAADKIEALESAAEEKPAKKTKAKDEAEAAAKAESEAEGETKAKQTKAKAKAEKPKAKAEKTGEKAEKPKAKKKKDE